MSFMYSETLVFVEDLDAAVTFYRDRVGLTLKQREEWGFALLEVPGGGRLGVLTTASWDAGGERISRPRMSLRTDDIEGEVARLVAAGVDVDKIRDDAGPMRAVCFRDGDGNEFFLWEDPTTG
jgi:predicted enzyme related to lactoylglutathione lyase